MNGFTTCERECQPTVLPWTGWLVVVIVVGPKSSLCGVVVGRALRALFYLSVLLLLLLNAIFATNSDFFRPISNYLGRARLGRSLDGCNPVARV
ncbi:hypothetical protein CpipJ_CPIJ006148 [Culex quinquefasciatus]|uniref:Uncharacterized protein n=1 Tax=Culex quinquefasciatus TaxID=7176 RepID=B0WFV8_CULQU|nr:hypothetical protein CpipJ_CPIJ006148 [Culex quinquefasciatus]|eukprot:XP_001847592.1 hypothetical protein CpipJ_CPIJ006148 [Culex quinquefasciatus]